MAIKEIHVGDIGTVFELTIKDEENDIVDISSQSSMEIVFQKPNHTIVTKNAELVNTGTDGKVQYVTVAGDLDIAGVSPKPHWALQAVVVLPAGIWNSDIRKFDVHPNLKPLAP